MPFIFQGTIYRYVLDMKMSLIWFGSRSKVGPSDGLVDEGLLNSSWNPCSGRRELTDSCKLFSAFHGRGWEDDLTSKVPVVKACRPKPSPFKPCLKAGYGDPCFSPQCWGARADRSLDHRAHWPASPLGELQAS